MRLSTANRLTKTTATLENGDNLSRAEFLRIWEKLPHIKRAELIGGVVYMPSPVWKPHGSIGRHLATWQGVYQAYTPGCTGGENTTSLIGPDCVQPDGYLALLPEYGGASWGDKHVEGAPELIAGVSASTVSIDLHQKLALYQGAGVQEYLVAVARKKEVRWHQLVNDKYRLLRPDARGIYRSRVFPGLWLDSKALFAGDLRQVLACLQEGLRSAEHERFLAELAARKR